MAKRFSETEIWNEDWFLDMPNEYKLFWFYMLAKCDHAGLFKVNLRSFRGLIEGKLTSSEVLKHFNNGKERIRILSENLWFIEDGCDALGACARSPACSGGSRGRRTMRRTWGRTLACTPPATCRV